MRRISDGFLFSALIVLLGCTTWRSVKVQELTARDLAGRWSSGQDNMSISCGGEFAYELKPGSDLLGDLRQRQMAGGFITEVGPSEFVVGPIRQVFYVQQWPQTQGKVTRMTVDGHEWRREGSSPCSTSHLGFSSQIFTIFFPVPSGRLTFTSRMTS